MNHLSILLNWFFLIIYMQIIHASHQQTSLVIIIGARGPHNLETPTDKWMQAFAHMNRTISFCFTNWNTNSLFVLSITLNLIIGRASNSSNTNQMSREAWIALPILPSKYFLKSETKNITNFHTWKHKWCSISPKIQPSNYYLHHN